MSKGIYVGLKEAKDGLSFKPSPEENYYIFAGATKPFHSGHDQMIRHAINDAKKDPKGKVILYIGLGDRGPVKGELMGEVWKKYIEDYYESISPNIHIEYGGGPIGKVLCLLGDANSLVENGEIMTNKFFIYTDPNDANSYYLEPTFSKRNPGVELKSSPPSYSKSLRKLDPSPVSFMGIDYPERFTRGGDEGTDDISGTQMRLFLQEGDSKSFISNLPSWMNDDIKSSIYLHMKGQQ